MPKFIREFTAGGMVFRRHKGRVEILMIQDSKGRWTIPKGHVEKGEKLEETAIREIGEETGLTNLKVIERLDKTHFFYRRQGRLIFMTMYVFLIEAGADDELIPENNEGIVDVRWFDQKSALNTVAYETTAKLFKLGLRKLQHVRAN